MFRHINFSNDLFSNLPIDLDRFKVFSGFTKVDNVDAHQSCTWLSTIVIIVLSKSGWQNPKASGNAPYSDSDSASADGNNVSIIIANL